MKFIHFVENLKKEHAGDTLVRKNGTLILCPGKIPKAKHIIYKGLSSRLIKEELID